MKSARTLALVAVVAAGAAVPFFTSSAPAVARAADAASAGAFKLDPVHSMVIFRVGHMGVSYTWGRFNEPTGDYLIDAADPSKSNINITLSAEKIDTASAGRDRHLKSPDFFNAGEFPSITFKSKSVTKSGEKSFDVAGELTLLGVTKPVTAKLTYIGEGQTKQGYKSGFEAEFTIKRSEFGMTKYLEENAIGDEVTLFVSVEGARG